MIETTGSVNTGLTGNNYAFNLAAAGYLSYPAASIGTLMQTSSSGAVRGLGAGLSTVGAGLLSKGKDLFKGALGAGFGMGAAGAVLSAVAGPKLEYSGYKGGTTQALDTAYDAIATGVLFIPGVGLIIGGAMQLGKGIGAVTNKLGGGTDAMTDVDAVLGSNFFNISPLGLVNGFGGKKSHTMGGNDFMTQSALNNQWAGYGGTYKDYNYASTKANKKYGLFSRGARKRANRLIDLANMNRETLLDVNRLTELGNIRGNMMADINGARYNQSLYGGFNANLLRMGKLGLKIQDINRAKRLNSKLVHNIIKVEDVVDSFLKGGKPKKVKSDLTYAEFIATLPVNLQKGNDGENGYRMRYAFDNSPNVWTFDDAKGKFINWNDEDKSWHGSSVFGPTGEFLKSSTHPTIHYEIDWYNSNVPEAVEFRKKYKLITTDENGKPLKYYRYVPRKTQAFKEGGSMNVIPEGALHARLHHMDNADNLTKKGIPVVDNQGNQLAEIELNEIIFRKAVTDKLEELAKDGSDEAAIEAGKLLVEEILYNTDDRTGLINTVEVAKNGTKLMPKLLSGNIITPSQSHLDSLQNITTEINSKNLLGFIDKNNKLKALQSIGDSLVNAFSDITTANKKLKSAKKEMDSKLDGSLLWYKWMELLKLMAKADVLAQEEQDNRDRALLYELRSLV